MTEQSTVKPVFDQRYAPTFCKWLNEHIKVNEPNANFVPETTLTFANVDFTDIVAPKILFVAAYHGRTAHTCQISCASNGEKRSKLTKEFLRALFSYAFMQDKRTAIYASIDSQNLTSIALCEQCGFKRVGILPDCNGFGRDALAYALTKKQWLEHPYSKNPNVSVANQ
jgi:hypothetical protein